MPYIGSLLTGTRSIADNNPGVMFTPTLTVQPQSSALATAAETPTVASALGSPRAEFRTQQSPYLGAQSQPRVQASLLASLPSPSPPPALDPQHPSVSRSFGATLAAGPALCGRLHLLPAPPPGMPPARALTPAPQTGSVVALMHSLAQARAQAMAQSYTDVALCDIDDDDGNDIYDDHCYEQSLHSHNNYGCDSNENNGDNEYDDDDNTPSTDNNDCEFATQSHSESGDTNACYQHQPEQQYRRSRRVQSHAYLQSQLQVQQPHSQRNSNASTNPFSFAFTSSHSVSNSVHVSNSEQTGYIGVNYSRYSSVRDRGDRDRGHRLFSTNREQSIVPATDRELGVRERVSNYASERSQNERVAADRDRSFACSWPGCDKRFSERANLKRHLKQIHLGVREFLCPVNDCGQRFGRKSHLVHHLSGSRHAAVVDIATIVGERMWKAVIEHSRRRGMRANKRTNASSSSASGVASGGAGVGAVKRGRGRRTAGAVAGVAVNSTGSSSYNSLSASASVGVGVAQRQEQGQLLDSEFECEQENDDADTSDNDSDSGSDGDDGNANATHNDDDDYDDGNSGSGSDGDGDESPLQRRQRLQDQDEEEEEDEEEEDGRSSAAVPTSRQRVMEAKRSVGSRPNRSNNKWMRK